jgi:carboxyl-terminal processing protease
VVGGSGYNPGMKREKFAWLISLLIVALLAMQIQGSMAARDDDYAFVRTLVEIHRLVAANWVDAVDEDHLRTGAIDGMLGELDPFTNYVPAEHEEEFDRALEGSFKGVGIQLNQLEDGRIEVATPIDGSPAVRAGVQAGDIILKVNGESIEGLRIPELIKKVTGPIGSQVTMKVRHLDGREVELSMTRQEIIVPVCKGFGRKDDNSWRWFVSENPKIAYVRVTQFTPDVAQRLRDVLEPLISDGLRGLVLDLRFDPGGRLDQARDVVNLFIDHGVIVSTKGRNRPEEVYTAKPGQMLQPYFPMIVLVNGYSASASEVVAGSLQDNRRALVLGSRSYGKGSVQELIPLDARDGELKLTVAYYYLPSGRCVHRRKDSTDWGVDPQITVPMDTAAEASLLRAWDEQEQFHRLPAKSTTQPSTQKATRAKSAAAPATQPIAQATTPPATQPAMDPQLQRAVDTISALLLLEGDQGRNGWATRTGSAEKVPPVSMRVNEKPPTTEPAEEPAQK